MPESTGGPLWPDRDAKHDPLENLQRAMELVETHGHHPEPDPISPGMFRRLRSWFSSRLQAFDESHVVDLGDADDVPNVPEMVCVIDEVDWSDPAVVAATEAQRRQVAGLKFHYWKRPEPEPEPEPVCVFCPKKATEEIFVGWDWAKDHGHGPAAAVVQARFARVCINHVGHSRFTRSNSPVDEL